MKKLYLLIISLTLVMVLAVTGVYAVDFTGYFVGDANTTTVNSFDDGFTVSTSRARFAYAVPATVVSSMSGTVNWTLASPGVADQRIWWSGNSYVTVSDLTGLVNCTVSADNKYVYPVAGATSGSFSFTVQYSTAIAMPAFATGSSTNTSQNCTFEFESLVIDGTPIVSPIIGESIPITLEPGYAYIIEGPCEVTERSFSLSNSWDFITNFENSQERRVNGSSERLLAIGNVRDGFSPDKGLSRSALVQWSALNANSQGVASNYSFSASDVITVASGSCYVLTYPEYYGVNVYSDSTRTFQNAVNLTGSIYLTYSERPTLRKVAVKTVEEWVSREYFIYNVFRPEVYDEIGTVISGEAGTSVDFPSAPSGGGNAGQPPLNEDTTILGIFSKFVNDVKGLFTSAVNAINDLVSTGSSFMQSVGVMFTWLPAPLLTVITGAFVVLLVVGVLKVLWR